MLNPLSTWPTGTLPLYLMNPLRISWFTRLEWSMLALPSCQLKRRGALPQGRESPDERTTGNLLWSMTDGNLFANVCSIYKIWCHGVIVVEHRVTSTWLCHVLRAVGGGTQSIPSWTFLSKWQLNESMMSHILHWQNACSHLALGHAFQIVTGRKQKQLYR